MEINKVPILPPLYLKTIPAKVPKWDMNHLVHRKCPVCEAEGSYTICVRPDTLRVVKCERCNMVYVQDIPSEHDLGNFYRAYSQFKELKEPRRSPFRKLLNAILLDDPHVMILEKTGGLKGKKVCEIGCSYGNFLFRLKELGSGVSAVELDTEAVNFLKKEDIPVYDRIPISPKFDAICAFNLLEHLADPADLIKEAAGSLGHGGRLLLSLPNSGEIEKVGPWWVGFRVDLEHLNYFSVKSLGSLLIQYGFYIEHYYEYNQPSIFLNKGYSLFEKINRIRKRILLKMFSAPFYEEGTFELTVLARKY